MHNYVLITGASTGIGNAVCHDLKKLGYGIIATVRNSEDRIKLATQLGDGHLILEMDVRHDHSVMKSYDEVRKFLGQDKALVAVVNNAGIALNGPVLYVPVEEWKNQLDINVLGVVRVTQAFFRLLREGKTPHPRRIIMMSSISGLFARPFLGPYASSKFALEALSDSLRREMFDHGVDVVLIEPGSIMTPIWDKAIQSPDYIINEYSEIGKLRTDAIEHTKVNSLPVERVTSIIRKTVTSSKVKPRYLIMKGAWKFRLIRMLPTGITDRIAHKMLKKMTRKA